MEAARGHFPPVTQGEVSQKRDQGGRRPSGGEVTRLRPVGHDALGHGFGCDRISLSFPVRDVDDAEAWPMETVKGRGTAGESWTRGRNLTSHDPVTGEVGKVSVFIGVTEVNGNLWGKVETNPSRFVDPSGCSLLPVEQVGLAVHAMAAAAAMHLTPAAPVEDWSVKRIDMARDFRGIGAPAFYVGGLLYVHRPYARRTYIYADPGKGNAQTLWAGGKGGGARLYDQHEAYAEKGAPLGSLRWEVEARGGNGSWLEKVGVERVEQLVHRTSGLRALAEQRWEWSGMGREIGSVAEAVQQVQGMGLSAAKRQRLLGALLEDACGVRGEQSKNTETEYRRMKKQLGFVMVPAIDRLMQPGAVRGRLDWESGTEVAA